jgi:hypothetical protein
MKTRKYILLGVVMAGLGLGVTSCSDYLDVQRYFKGQQTEDRIFEDKDYTLQWLSYCYNALQGDNLEIAHSDVSPTNFSDDMVFNEGDNGGRYRAFKLGEYGHGYAYSDYYMNSWPKSYNGIRQASILIQNVDKNLDLTQEEITDVKGQARFVRAYLYWLLLRKYGPVPIMPDMGADYSGTYDELSFPRNTYDECAEYIASEMLQAAKELKEKRDNVNVARATKGAALAVRAKAYLYAASPLANGNTEMADFTDKTGRVLISQEYNEEKWAKAAAAARDLIELAENRNLYRLYTALFRDRTTDEAYPNTITPPEHPVFSHQDFPNGWQDIDPFESYRSLFNGDLYATENPELVFTRGGNADKEATSDENIGVKELVKHQLPGTLGGWNIHGVTQKQCDTYAMADGTPFDRAACPKKLTADNNRGEHPYDHLRNNVFFEYANREPRFYASIAFSGSVWYCLSAERDEYKYQQIFYYRGASNGRVNANERWVPTGIGVMKFVHPEDCAANNGKILDKVDTAIRYADILLMYAEALNELSGTYQIESWDGSTSYTISRDINQMRRGMKPVRMRAGVPDFEDAVYNAPDEFRKQLKHERQVEFFAENQRFWDLRRWKDAPKEEGEQIFGCNTLMNADHYLDFYTPVRVPYLQTAFSRKQYFWPITYQELKRNKNMTQAPGWEDYD